MTLPRLICQYCAHRNTGADSRCAHCGAPLSGPVAPEPGHPILAEALSGTAKLAMGAEHGVAEAEKMATDAEKGLVVGVGRLIEQRLAGTSWRVALIGVAVLVVLAFLIIRGCSAAVPRLGRLDSLDALPALLRTAATCQHSTSPQPVDNCVVDSSSALLMGGITGGAPLRFSVQIEQPNQIAETIAGWRAAGPTILANGSVFVAIGPSATAWYADARSGLRIETGSFTDRTGARNFLVRAGLIL